jgi:2-polyprenyl-6-methoxyphenol hydroxylase-like FAD-dependent oxidoreductase
MRDPITWTRDDEAVDCCISGCGPAGAMLGLLLARAGARVVVLEKHADFLRDFRGDTIHPSTLEILDELGLAERFLALPHSEVSVLTASPSKGPPFGVDFRHIGSRFPFVAFVPQWDFLDFITGEAERYPTFRLVRNADVTGLIEDPEGRIRGVRYQTTAGEMTVRPLLTVGADGRTSPTRAAARLPLVETSPPMDVLWFRLSRRPSDGDGAELRLSTRHFVATFNRGGYWQVAYVIVKGGDAQLRAAGLQAFRSSVAELLPELADRVPEIDDWDKVKLLSVRSDRLTRWYRAGYLAIGDAAHAMSPIGGVGINLAIQDAVVAANFLWRPLLEGRLSTQTLRRVQRRRELPTRLIQGMQTFLQDRILEPALSSSGPLTLPLLVQAVIRVPFFGVLPAWLIGYGILRPHVRVPQLRETHWSPESQVTTFERPR